MGEGVVTKPDTKHWDHLSWSPAVCGGGIIEAHTDGKMILFCPSAGRAVAAPPAVNELLAASVPPESVSLEWSEFTSRVRELHKQIATDGDNVKPCALGD